MRARSLGSAVLGSAAMAMLASACASHGSFVRVDDVALGRVVVYRNGVAYYERRAQVKGDELTIVVPSDKVDDFLKSLTVLDASTGKPIGIAFPRQEYVGSGAVQMTIQLPSKRTTDLLLTYITEAPAWKPSYRVEIKDDGKVLLQGWAIVDNTSGEDWKNIYVGVGSSSALSFRYDLWSVRSVHRMTLADEERFAVAPPMGVTPYREVEATEGLVVTSLSDHEIPGSGRTYEGVLTSSPGAIGDSYGGSYGGGGGGGGDDGYGAMSIDGATTTVRGGTTTSRDYTKNVPPKSKPNAKAERVEDRRPVQPTAPPPTAPAEPPPPPADDKRLREVAISIQRQQNVVVIEGYAQSGEADADRRALERANNMRNILIDQGVPPAQLRVEGKGVVAGQSGGVRLVVAADEIPTSGAESDTPVGESHFTSHHPMTVKRASSAMVSIVREPTTGEVVYLFDPDSPRGNGKFAFRAVRFKNPTKSTLETGPLTVYGEGRFIGEGLSDPIPPEATAVVPFALDRQVVVSREDEIDDKIESLVTLQRGILTANVQHLRRSTFKITNRLSTPAKVFIRHTVRKGWEITDAPDLYERIGDAHLFQVDLPAGQTKTIDIEEATPIVKTVDLRSDVGLEMVKIYVDADAVDPEFSEQMKKLLALHKEIANHEQSMGSVRQRLADYRERMDELHAQILTLEAVKTKGELMTHLKTKLKEISDLVQKATIQLVDMEERAMLARIRFQDAVSELSFEEQAVANQAK